MISVLLMVGVDGIVLFRPYQYMEDYTDENAIDKQDIAQVLISSSTTTPQMTVQVVLTLLQKTV